MYGCVVSVHLDCDSLSKRSAHLRFPGSCWPCTNQTDEDHRRPRLLITVTLHMVIQGI